MTEFWNRVDSISDEGSSLVNGDPIQQTYNPVKMEQPDYILGLTGLTNRDSDCTKFSTAN